MVGYYRLGWDGWMGKEREGLVVGRGSERRGLYYGYTVKASLFTVCRQLYTLQANGRRGVSK